MQNKILQGVALIFEFYTGENAKWARDLPVMIRLGVKNRDFLNRKTCKMEYVVLNSTK